MIVCESQSRTRDLRSRRLGATKPRKCLGVVFACGFNLGHAEHGEYVVRVSGEYRLVTSPSRRQILLLQVELGQVHERRLVITLNAHRLLEARARLGDVLASKID